MSSKPFTATSFKPWTPPPADLIGDNLKKHGVTDAEDIKVFKSLLTDMKKHLDESKDGVISMDLFKKVGELKIC